MSIRSGGLRLVLTIALWGLAGVALVVLPGLLAQNPTRSPDVPVTSSFNSKLATGTPVITSQPGQQQTTATDFLVRLLIILVPAMALSTIGGTWVSNRVRRVSV